MDRNQLEIIIGEVETLENSLGIIRKMCENLSRSRDKKSEIRTITAMISARCRQVGAIREKLERSLKNGHE